MAYTISSAPLPTNFLGTPQELLEAFLDRLEITSDVVGFITTDTAPVSNDGVWLKAGKQIWVWDDDVDGGSYVPLDVSSSVIPQIWVGPGTTDPVTPDTALYSIWLKVVDGAVVGLFYWTGSEWITQSVVIEDGSITNEKLADASVSTNKLRNGAVTSAKLAGSIPMSKFELGVANYYVRMNSAGTEAGWRAADAADDPVQESDLLPLSGISWAGFTKYVKFEFEHALGAAPRHLQVVMVCNSANLGYVAGDEVTPEDSVMLRASATKLYCYLHEGIQIVNISDTGDYEPDTPTWSKWDLKFYYAKGTA